MPKGKKKRNLPSVRALIKKRRKTKYKRAPQPAPPTPAQQVEYLLEQTNLASLRQAKKLTDDLLKYHWKFYYELAQQRDAIVEKLNAALLKNAVEKYCFSGWQRAVRWKYSLHPMCTVGSRTFVGQRFNYGDEINTEISSFPCLYLAADKDTALQETLGQPAEGSRGLSPREIALASIESETIVSMSGCLDQIIDLRSSDCLIDFVELIKDFELSKETQETAKTLGDNASVITTPDSLLETFLIDDWRDRPVNYQVPSNSQIIGQLIAKAGIHGILYPSKMTGKDCLAIFTQNFANSECYLEFDHTPPDTKAPKRVDANNYQVTFKQYSEL